jgi:hypothetical protein
MVFTQKPLSWSLLGQVPVRVPLLRLSLVLLE